MQTKSKEFKELLLSFFKNNFSIKIKNIDLFIQAFTHKSANQNKHIKKEKILDYDSLEFFGDSLLNFIITSLLFDIETTSGTMSKLRQQIIQSSSLSFVFEKHGLSPLIQTGHSIKQEDIPQSIKEDVFESLVAAIYLDCGLTIAKKFICDTLWNSYLNNELDFAIDYKTILQEYIYSKYKLNVIYINKKIIDQSTNKEIYFVECQIPNIKHINCSGLKIKELEKKCAKLILISYGFFTRN